MSIDTTLFDQVSKDIITAMKAQEKEKLDPLRFLKSLLIQNKTAAKPTAELDILVAHMKKLKDSLEMFPAGTDGHQKIVSEMKILEVYMPQQLSSDEVKAIIQNIISSHPGANMGVVMKELSPQIKGKFDGKLANDLVKSLLS